MGIVTIAGLQKKDIGAGIGGMIAVNRYARRHSPKYIKDTSVISQDIGRERHLYAVESLLAAAALAAEEVFKADQESILRLLECMEEKTNEFLTNQEMREQVLNDYNIELQVTGK